MPLNATLNMINVLVVKYKYLAVKYKTVVARLQIILLKRFEYLQQTSDIVTKIRLCL